MTGVGPDSLSRQLPPLGGSLHAQAVHSHVRRGCCPGRGVMQHPAGAAKP